MRQLILKMDCSLDGFVGRANGDLAWLFPDFDEEHAEWLAGRLWQAGAHVMGSAAYRGMASHWPNSTEAYAAPMNQIPKIIFSHSRLPLPWGEARTVCGDLALEISRLKREPGKPLLAHGGAGFARDLIDTGLIDEYWLIIHPVALRDGLRLFAPAGEPIRLVPVSQDTFKSGVMACVFRPA